MALTGHRRAYFRDYTGSPQELLSAIRRGWLFQGQRYDWHDKQRGTSALDLRPERYVAYLENHDQIADTGLGQRLHQRTSRGQMRALTALLLLGPATPMLFQGQEYASPAPFRFFADVGPDVREPTRAGRREQMGQFPNLAPPEMVERLPDPTQEATIQACQIGAPSTHKEKQALALHRDLLRLRREDPVIRLQDRGGFEGAVIGPEAFLFRAFGPAGDERLVLVNLGADLDLPSLPEPLLALPEGRSWRLLWSSEHPDYGGEGTPPVETGGRWFLPGRATVVMTSTVQSGP